MPDLSGGDDLISSYYGSVRYFSWKSLVYATSQESPDEHLLQHVGNDHGASDGLLLVQHLRGHPLCLQLPEQHRLGSRHHGGQPAHLVGRGALPDRPPAPDPAGVLRSDRPGPGGDRPECAGQQRERAAQHLRRVRQLHRRGVPQSRRDAARLLGAPSSTAARSGPRRWPTAPACCSTPRRRW